MTAVRLYKQRLALLLLNFSAWVRSQAWLQVLYRRFPMSWRVRVSSGLAAPARSGLKFTRTPQWNNWPRAGMPAPIWAVSKNGGLSSGVNIHAHVRGQFGLAENARLYARALIEDGYPLALCDIDIPLPHSLEDRSLDRWVGEEAPFPVDIIFVNPDHLDVALRSMRARGFKRHYTIGCWFWELENFPEEWLPALECVDEVMVSSAYVEQAVRRVTQKPVIRIPVPVSDVGDSGLQRADFGIDDNAFVFLCTFDFNSFLQRKNPFAVIRAFREAFLSDRQDVRLVVKSSNGHRHPERLLDLLNELDGDARITVRDEIIAREHIQALQRCCDAYVSLHRAEGFGLGLAEAMRQGKPVIATGYSGNLEFMNSGNSLLVDYRLVEVPEGAYMHVEGQRWAEPDVAHAAVMMRSLVDEPGLAARLGRQAFLDMREGFSAERCASALTAHLDQVGLRPPVMASLKDALT